MTFNELEELIYSRSIEPASYFYSGNAGDRIEQIEIYLSGKIQNPAYIYEKLEAYVTGYLDKLSADKDFLKSCIIALEEFKTKNEIEKVSVTLHILRLESMLKERELIKSSHTLLNCTDPELKSSELERHLKLNEEIYGKLDPTIFDSVGKKVSMRNGLDLKKYERHIEYYTAYAKTKFAAYHNRFSLYPNDKKFTSEEAVDECNSILSDIGLRQKGWIAVVSESALIVSTDYSAKEIKFPQNLTRTASELKRLFVHEIEAHIRCFDNGKKYSSKLLSAGTVSQNVIGEGLGIFNEIIVDDEPLVTHPAYLRAVDRYVALCYALGLDGKARTPNDVYLDMVYRMYGEKIELGVNQDKTPTADMKYVFSIIDNIYRGSDFKEATNVFFRAKMYIDGLIGVLEHLYKMPISEKTLDDMYIAKYDFTNELDRKLISLNVR